MTVILHIPHDGHEFPEELKQFCIISDEELKQYDFEMSDIYLKHIVKDINCKKISFSISRLLCDVERFPENEPMEQFGMGYCYSQVYDGKKIKQIDENILNITKEYYNNYHQNLDDNIKKSEPPIFFIDLHSFNPKTTKKELLIKNKSLPDICIGYDSDFCSPLVLESILNIFKKHNYNIEINYPYSGTLVPNIVLKNTNKFLKKFTGIMIEINRSIYIGTDGFLIPKEHMRLHWALKEICELF